MRRLATPLRENEWVGISELTGSSDPDGQAAWLRGVERESRRIRSALGLREAALQFRAADEGYEIRPTGIAGTLTLGRVTLDITPKFIQGDASTTEWHTSVLVLLERARRRHHTYARAAEIGRQSGSFVDHMARAYADALAKGLSTEPIHVYRSTEYEGTVLRGRISLSGQLRAAVLRPGRIVSETDALDADNSYNQLLDWACGRFSMAVADSALRRRLGLLRDRIPAASPRSDRPPTVNQTAPPQYRAWVDALEIAALLASGATLSPQRGSFVGYGFVLAMERLFERFVQESLSIAVSLLPTESAARAVSQDTHAYAQPIAPGVRQFFSRPDNVIYLNDVPALVVDAKYKRFRDAEDTSFKPSNADVYELVAAMTAHRCKRGLLVYPRLRGDTELESGQLRSWNIDAFGTELVASAVAIDLGKLKSRADLGKLDQGLAQTVTAAIEQPS